MLHYHVVVEEHLKTDEIVHTAEKTFSCSNCGTKFILLRIMKEFIRRRNHSSVKSVIRNLHRQVLSRFTKEFTQIRKRNNLATLSVT